MMEPASQTSNLYGQLSALPENLVGEIVNGRLHTRPRPSGPHAVAESSLGDELIGPYQKGKGGPGGWWIIIEPEVHFVLNEVVTVPDLAGWRRARMPRPPEGHRFEVIPDWVCEILSSSTEKFDRTEKMPLYAQYGVRYFWVINPVEKTLEAYELIEDRWTLMGVFKDEQVVQIAPFQEVAIALPDLWIT